jgi:hypothetical protein
MAEGHDLYPMALLGIKLGKQVIQVEKLEEFGRSSPSPGRWRGTHGRYPIRLSPGAWKGPRAGARTQNSG